MREVLLAVAGRRRSPATLPGFHTGGRCPRTRASGLRSARCSCVATAPPRGRAWSVAAARAQLRQAASRAGVRRRFAAHQLRHPHAVEMARERVPLIVIQRQRAHQPRAHVHLVQGRDSAEIIEAVHGGTRRWCRRQLDAPPVSTGSPLPVVVQDGSERGIGETGRRGRTRQCGPGTYADGTRSGAATGAVRGLSWRLPLASATQRRRAFGRRCRRCPSSRRERPSVRRPTARASPARRTLYRVGVRVTRLTHPVRQTAR